MTSPESTGKPGGSASRGRPRSEETRLKIMRATSDLLRESGMPALTIEAVAARAGVGKPTIYRYWANANELAMAALMETAPAKPASGTSDDALGRVRAILYRISETFSHATGRYVASMLAASHEDSEVSKAFRSHFIRARREEVAAELNTARKVGLIRKDAEIDLALDMLFGAVFYHLLMNQAAMNTAYMDNMFKAVMRGLEP